MRNITQEQALDYEITSSRISPLIGWDWLQKLLAKYYVRKVKRKFKRYDKIKRFESRYYSRLVQ